MTTGLTSTSKADRLGLRDLPLILMYHAVGGYEPDPNLLAVSTRRFSEQMATLHRRGLRGVSIAELVEAIRDGRHRGMVGITFDDGYADLVTEALPVLQHHSFGATVFVIADRIGGTNEWDEGPVWRLLDATGVRQLADGGLEIGSHGATHVRLAGLAADRLAYEVVASRDALSALIDRPVNGFAYPYGSMDAASRAAVRAAGYAYACAVSAGRAARGPLALPRLYVGERDSGVRIAIKRLAYRAHICLRGGIR